MKASVLFLLASAGLVFGKETESTKKATDTWYNASGKVVAVLPADGSPKKLTSPQASPITTRNLKSGRYFRPSRRYYGYRSYYGRSRYFYRSYSPCLYRPQVRFITRLSL